MSKQSEAKDKQGYTTDRKVCSTCKHYTSVTTDVKWMFGDKTYKVENNLRCGLGGFAVKKTATCSLWEKK